MVLQYLSEIVNQLKKVHSDTESKIEKNPVPKKRVFDSNIRMVRAGCLIRKKKKGIYYYLLGRLVKDYEPPKDPKLKTAGGYLRLSEEYYNAPDLSSIDGLVRELAEEGFSGKYAPVIDTIVPVGVALSHEKGVLQFYIADLRKNPAQGMKKEQVFKKRKDNSVYLRWCSVKDLVGTLGNKTPELLVQPETVEMILASHYYSRSKRVLFDKSDVSTIVKPDGNLIIPDDYRKKILDTTGLTWLENKETLKTCKVYYSVPDMKASSDIFPKIPCIKIFFMTDLFMIDKELVGSSLDEHITESISAMKTYSPEWAKAIIKNYVRSNYYETLGIDLLKDYLIPDKKK